jgi:hypothetical protein
VAGGRGLGFNGGELLALAVGGCLCNDLRYVAHRRGVMLADFTVDVEVHVDAHGSVERVAGRHGVALPRRSRGCLQLRRRMASGDPVVSMRAEPTALLGHALASGRIAPEAVHHRPMFPRSRHSEPAGHRIEAQSGIPVCIRSCLPDHAVEAGARTRREERPVARCRRVSTRS